MSQWILNTNFHKTAKNITVLDTYTNIKIIKCSIQVFLTEGSGLAQTVIYKAACGFECNPYQMTKSKCTPSEITPGLDKAELKTDGLMWLCCAEVWVGGSDYREQDRLHGWKSLESHPLTDLMSVHSA